MEALLSLSFDNISSKDGNKIRKGLRQIEGLLAQICLARGGLKSPEKRKASAASEQQPSSAKQLETLGDDPAFREFFRLQDGFEWNVATKLVSCLERLLGMGNSGQNDILIVSTLDLIQGILLLHPPSRCLFGREIYMNLLLDLLEPSDCPAIQSHTLLVLVSALLDRPQNTRTFEKIDGILTVTSLFKSRSTTREVKLKVVEFLYFYLMPETPAAMSISAPVTAVVQRSPSKLAGYSRSATGMPGTEGPTKTSQEKQRLLGVYLSNVDDLVEDLRDNAPFGDMVY